MDPKYLVRISGIDGRVREYPPRQSLHIYSHSRHIPLGVSLLRMNCTRRELLAGLSMAALGPRLPAAAQDKPMRGVFIIMATPYTESDSVDYEDLAREVDFLGRCGVQGMVWPQLASEYSKLTREE